jgi:hypothetical protein
MSVKNVIDQTLQKPMDRKDFLSHVGAVFLAVIGVTSVLHSLGAHDAQQQRISTDKSASGGYGSSPYGV